MKDTNKERVSLLFNIVTTRLDIWYIEQRWMKGLSCKKALMSDLSPSLDRYINEWKEQFGELPVSLSDVDALFEWLLWYRKEVSDSDVEKWFKEPI